MAASYAASWVAAVAVLALCALIAFGVSRGHGRLVIVAILAFAASLGVCVALAFAVFPHTRGGAPLAIVAIPEAGALLTFAAALFGLARLGQSTRRTAAMAFGAGTPLLVITGGIAAQIVACRFDQCINL